MARLGFHASHEQVSPKQLLRDVIHAERVGFDAAMCSDHLLPWSERQGHSGFAFSWLGAALASTTFPIGSVTAPGQRYHPVITAQAIATLGQMFPGRYWAALGSGQNLNEHITGQPWSDAPTRRRRLEECVHIIRRLHHGETVSHRGLVTVQEAHLYDLPDQLPPLYAACISPESARGAAAWADGIITVNQPEHAHRETLEAYRQAGGSGPGMLQVHLSWAASLEEAKFTAYEQWRYNSMGQLLAQDLPTPAHFDAAAHTVDPAQVSQAVWISDNGAQLTEWVLQGFSMGFDMLYLHHVGQDQQPWLDYAGEHILPVVKEHHANH